MVTRLSEAAGKEAYNEGVDPEVGAGGLGRASCKRKGSKMSVVGSTTVCGFRVASAAKGSTKGSLEGTTEAANACVPVGRLGGGGTALEDGGMGEAASPRTKKGSSKGLVTARVETPERALLMEALEVVLVEVVATEAAGD